MAICFKTKKQRYYDEVAALLALAEIKRKDSSKREKQEQRAYKCQFCKGWHLTSVYLVIEVPDE